MRKEEIALRDWIDRYEKLYPKVQLLTEELMLILLRMEQTIDEYKNVVGLEMTRRPGDK